MEPGGGRSFRRSGARHPGAGSRSEPSAAGGRPQPRRIGRDRPHRRRHGRPRPPAAAGGGHSPGPRHPDPSRAHGVSLVVRLSGQRSPPPPVPTTPGAAGFRARRAGRPGRPIRAALRAGWRARTLRLFRCTPRPDVRGGPTGAGCRPFRRPARVAPAGTVGAGSGSGGAPSGSDAEPHGSGPLGSGPTGGLGAGRTPPAVRQLSRKVSSAGHSHRLGNAPSE